jgi:hypothetical protein
MDAADSARRGTITRLLGTMRCWVPFLVAMLEFFVIPVLLIIGAGIAAFSIDATALVTATSSFLLCKFGALRVYNFCNHSFAILIQKVQGLLMILGI